MGARGGAAVEEDALGRIVRVGQLAGIADLVEAVVVEGLPGEVLVKISGQRYSHWRVVDHEGEVPEVLASKRRDCIAALRLLKRAMKRYRWPKAIVTNLSLLCHSISPNDRGILQEFAVRVRFVRTD